MESEGDFVSGELLVGVRSTHDREKLVAQLEQSGWRYRTGSEDLATLAVTKMGGSALRLKVEYSDAIKARLGNDPRAELDMLNGLARHLKALNPNISYAHPNWIARTAK